MDATSLDLGVLLAIDLERLMQLDMMLRIVLQVFLLMASAFFSGSETALFSLSRYDLQHLKSRRDPKFPQLQNLLERPRQLIISILCGNEIINVAAVANMTGILVALYGPEVGGVLNVFLMVPLLLLFGEVTPKTIAVSDPVKISTKIISAPLTVWVKLIAPFRWLIRQIADRVTTFIVGQETASENILQVDEFRSLVDEVVKGGDLTANERSLIYNLLEAGTTEVIEIMIPRTKVRFVRFDTPIKDLVDMVRHLRHTRLPVYKNSQDDLLGFIHAEDIMKLVLDDADVESLKIEDLIQPPVIVPVTKKVDEMFDYFLQHKAQAAAVLNEFGGIDGLITLKRVLSFVFGEITPESSKTTAYKQIAENVYEVSGEMKLTALESLTNFGLSDSRMTTVGGIVLRAIDRIPKINDEIVIEGVVLKVIEMQGMRISKLLVSKGHHADLIEKQDNKQEEGRSQQPG